MFVKYTGKDSAVLLYNDNNAIVRRFLAKAKVVNAVINGSGKEAIIAVTCVDGKVYTYRTNGTLIRKT